MGIPKKVPLILGNPHIVANVQHLTGVFMQCPQGLLAGVYHPQASIELHRDPFERPVFFIGPLMKVHVSLEQYIAQTLKPFHFFFSIFSLYFISIQLSTSLTLPLYFAAYRLHNPQEAVLGACLSLCSRTLGADDARFFKKQKIEIIVS